MANIDLKVEIINYSYCDKYLNNNKITIDTMIS